MGNPFKGQTVTQVSSVTYNLAGDIREKEGFIRKTVFQSVYLQKKPNISQSITTALFNSNAFHLKHYMNWLQTTKNGQQYKDYVGYSATEIEIGQEINQRSLGILLKPAQNKCVHIVETEITKNDLSWWAGIYLEEYCKTHPNNADYLTYPNSVELVPFEQTETHLQKLQINIRVPDESEQGYHIISLYALLPYLKNGVELLPVYSRNTNFLCVQYQCFDCVDLNNDNIYDQDAYDRDYEAWMRSHSSEDQVENPTPKPGYNGNEPFEYFIYEQGSDPNGPFEEFFTVPIKNEGTLMVPPIPFRLNNISLSEAVQDPAKIKNTNLRNKVISFQNNNNMNDIRAVYELSKKACSKAAQQKYKEYDKTILDNKNLGDIDYAYLFFGVSINTPNWAGQEYLYKFFKNLYNVYEAYQIETEPTPILGPDDTPESEAKKYIFLHANRHPLNFSYQICWTSAFYYPNQPIPSKAKFQKNKKYTTYKGSRNITKSYFDNDLQQEVTIVIRTVPEIYFVERINKTHCNLLTFSNLEHYNYVYDWESVHTSAESAFKYSVDSSEYSESAFLVPIHEGIFRSLPSLTRAELGEGFAYMLFNCYERKRLKWYQTSDFSSFMTVVPMGIAPIAAAWSIGYSVTNQIFFQTVQMSSAQLIGQLGKQLLISAVSMAAAKIAIWALRPILGDRFANIAGSAIGVLTYIGMNTGFDFSEMYEALTKSDNLIKLGIATLDGYAKGIEAETANIVRVGQKQIQEIQDKVNEFNEKYAAFYGETNMWANESFWFNLRTQVSPEAYFYFTLPRGAEIAERTLDYTVNYPEYSTRTYLATE